MVLIGVDPHKGSHTAVVVDRDEKEVARLTVRAASTGVRVPIAVIRGAAPTRRRPGATCRARGPFGNRRAA